jgi:hypothetical protein
MRKSARLATAAASAALLLCAAAQAGQAWRFHLEEATIADVHRAIRAKQITATRLVQNYFKRIEAYNGTCVKGGIDAATGLQLGEITPVENAGQLNAYMTLNVRGKRSKTDTADNDPRLPDALEVARAQDAYFARTGKFVGPLHGIPARSKIITTPWISARRRARRRITPTTNRRWMQRWLQSCGRRARSFSAKPISTSTHRRGSHAAV